MTGLESAHPYLLLVDTCLVFTGHKEKITGTLRHPAYYFALLVYRLIFADISQ
jgi:hypothetical protein